MQKMQYKFKKTSLSQMWSMCGVFLVTVVTPFTGKTTGMWAVCTVNIALDILLHYIYNSPVGVDLQ